MVFPLGQDAVRLSEPQAQARGLLIRAPSASAGFADPFPARRDSGLRSV